ncbi:MAG: hypothetical protein GY869_22375, partial [Planctomycetes bacterium]|nr:hypothetical protein [Planctomycetota bacterium]
KSIIDNQQATFEIKDIGTNFFNAHKVKPVPAFILALQMTAKRLTGKTLRVEQILAMSKYRCHPLVTANVTTPDVVSFVDYMDSGDVESGKALTLMREAIKSQGQECRKARRCTPLSQNFYLYLISCKGIRWLYVTFITVLTAQLLRILGLHTPREVIVSHPQIFPEVPVMGRPGIRLFYLKYFGLHYQLLEDRTVITMMPAEKWTIPNPEFITVLQENLERLQAIIREESSN